MAGITQGRDGMSYDEADNREVRRPRRRRRRVMVFLLLVVVGVAAGPTIVGRTPLRNTLLGLSVPVEGLRVESESGSFAWLGGQTVRGLSITDRIGNPLLTVESLSVDRSLASLASSKAGAVKLTIVRPIFYVATRADGSNIEDLLAILAADAEDDTGEVAEGTKREITIEVIDGAVRGLDTETEQKWLLSGANVSTTLAGADKVEVNGGAELSISPESQPVRVKFHLVQTAGLPEQLEVLTEQLPLEPLQSWLRRVLVGGQVTGTLSADAKLNWVYDEQGGATVQTSGHVDASGLEVTAEALGGDRLQFEQLEIPWKLSVTGEGVSVEQLEAKSEWVSLAVLGAMTFEEMRSLSLESLPKQPTEVAGRVQLDRLAAMLPRTLSLREGVRIDSGELEFVGTGEAGVDGFGWSASAIAKDIAGSDGTRPIRWEQPIEATVELLDREQGLQVTSLTVNAPFAEGTFDTSAEKIDGSFILDLEQLTAELGQFVDLGDWELQGRGEGVVSLSRGANEEFAATASLSLTDLHVDKAGKSLWAEPRLQAELKASGSVAGWELQRLATANLHLHGAGDQLEIELLEPAELKEENSSYKMRVQGNGPLASWAGRLRPWAATVPAEMSGDAYVKATLQVSAGRVHVLESEGSVAQLRVRGETLLIDEPRVQFAGDCLWDSVSNSLATRELQLVSSTLALRSQDLAVQLSDEETPTATGRVAFRGDMERLASLFGLVGQQDATWPRGMMAGTMELSSNPQQLQAEIAANVEQLQIVRSVDQSGANYGRPEVVWTEPELKLVGRATYLIAEDRVEVEDLQLSGKTVQLGGRAIVDKPRTEQQLHADGTLQYDSAELARLLASYLGPEVQVFGDRQIRFEVAGRLAEDETAPPQHWSQRFSVTADAGWSSAAVYGLPVGAGRLQGTIAAGRLQVAPLDLAVGQGRLKASPRGVLAPGPALLQLPKGVLFSNVDISPQVSETMLKYVAPIVAGATRTDGKFSVDLDETQVLLADPKQSRVSGRLAVHRLNVAPGAWMADVVRLVKQIEALSERKQLLQTVGGGSSSILTIDERQIEFQVADGRVYHRNLEFIVDGVPVRSQGSVGFDQTLSLLIEIPIQEKWIEKERALRTLAGQSIRIPVQGTFQQPRIDERAVADLSQQLLRGVAEEAIGGEINRALDKLFKGR